MKTKDKLKNGCGKRYCPSYNEYLTEEDYDEFAFHCRKGFLCPECETKLQQREEDEKEFSEIIKRFEEKVRDNHFILTEEMLEELKNENKR